VVGTNNELYNSGLQFKVTIKDKNQDETIAVFDPWHDYQPFALTNVDIDLSYFQIGAFSFTINDTKEKIIKDLLDNEMHILIEGGKTDALKVPFISGYADVKGVSSTRGDLIWTFTGLSKQAIWNYTQIDYQKIAPPSSITQLSPVFNSTQRIDRIIKTVMTSDDIFPIVDEKTLEERGDYNLDVLLGNVNELTGSIDFKGSAGLLFDNLANSAGAIILVDHSNQVQLVYPFSTNTGLVLKEYVSKEDASRDDPDRTGYIHGTLSKRESTSTNDGFFNSILLDYKQEEIAVSNEGEGIDFYSMDQKDVCFQFLPQSTTLSNLAFMLSKKGTGRSSIENAFDITGLQGFITVDDGEDNPSAGVVATFEIPYDRISSVPTIISGFNINRITPTFDPNRKHWCIFASSGVDSENTCLIFTDGDNTTPTDDNIPLLRRVGVRTPNIPKPNPQLKAGFHKLFQMSNTGPVPKHTFYTAYDNEFYAQDSLSIATYTPNRPKSTRISAPFIKDAVTAQKYTAAILEYSARKKIIFDEMTVQIPNNPIFPLQTGYIQYTPFGYTKQRKLLFEVNGARYSFSAADTPLGIDTCQLQVTAFYDHYLINTIHKDECRECIS